MDPDTCNHLFIDQDGNEFTYLEIEEMAEHGELSDMDIPTDFPGEDKMIRPEGEYENHMLDNMSD